MDTKKISTFYSKLLSSNPTKPQGQWERGMACKLQGQDLLYYEREKWVSNSIIITRTGRERGRERVREREIKKQRPPKQK